MLKRDYAEAFVNMGVGRGWKPEQLERLMEVWLRQPEQEAAALVGKSVEQCKAMAKLLDLRRRDVVLSPSIVAAELELHPNTVLIWCRKGLLPAVRSDLLRCYRGQVWDIDEKAYALFKGVWFSFPPSMRRMPYVFPVFRAKWRVATGNQRKAALA